MLFFQLFYIRKNSDETDSMINYLNNDNNYLDKRLLEHVISNIESKWYIKFEL